MKVLMFGWEFPPNISGGLGTACYGLTKALAKYNDIDLTFVVPKVHGNEHVEKFKLLGASELDQTTINIQRSKKKSTFKYISVNSRLVPYVSPDHFKQMSQFSVENTIPYIKQKTENKNEFTGTYGPNLMTEIENFSIAAKYIAESDSFDLIHAHDWLTYKAGIKAQKSIKKPLVVHVHATDYDRSGGRVNPEVYKMEQEGMQRSNHIITVSNQTMKTVRDNYQINPCKITTIYNGVEQSNSMPQYLTKGLSGKKIVTFLGRITLQKGPCYFVELAKKVLRQRNDVHFVMAGNGDMYHEIITQVAKAKIADRFHFTGFLKGDEVLQLLSMTDIYIMPSVSEPFGITPLEAMRCGVPVIISKQSGVSEILQNVIKIDFWDIDAMSNAINEILVKPEIRNSLVKNGIQEVMNIKWDNSAQQLRDVYYTLLAV